MEPKKPARLLGNDTSVPVFAEGGFALAVVSPDLAPVTHLADRACTFERMLISGTCAAV